MSSTRIVRSTATAAIVSALAAVAFAGSAQAATPVEMQFACALKSNGLLRYVTNLNQCKKTETKVTVKPGPVYVCVQPDGSSRLVSGPLACPAPPMSRQLVVLPPTSGIEYFCAANRTGVLRYVTDPALCTATETPVFVTPNDAAPSVSSTTPANGDLHIASDANITINFSESVSASAGSFTLVCGGSSRDFGVTGSPATTFTLDPTLSLPEGANCTVTVLANGVSDTDALDPPDNMAADYVFSFTVDAAPFVATTSPTDGATGVDLAANIEVDFSEPVSVTTSSFELECPSGSDQAFAVSGSGTSSITLDPDSNLPGAASCTVTAVAANISDVDTGDPPDHPAADTIFSFTTQDAAPTVTSTIPADGATDVARGTDIDVTFSEPVTAGASAFTLECPSGTPKTFTVSGSPGTTLTLDPDADLPAGETCTVTVLKDGISDVDSIDPPDHMAADFVFSFTLVANQAPTDIALSPASVDENEPIGTAVGSFSTTDPDAGDTFTYTLVGGTGSDDNGSFTIDGDTLKTDEVFDFEAKSSYSIRVETKDSGGLTFEKAFTISINDVNEAPTDIALSNDSIDENEPAGTTIGGLSATDPDAGQTHSFALVDSGCGGSFPDNDSFAIVGGDLKSDVSFNFEAKSSYTICIRTTDDGTPSLSFDEQFTIHINDVNDPPVGVADSYSGAIGNTLAVLGTTGSGPHVVLTGNVLTNNDTDEDVPAQPLSAVAETNASTGGGTATISSDGSFTFLPGVGDKNQNDTFTYLVTDGTATTAATVTVHIENFLVWYVNNSLGSNGDGRSSSPFTTLAGVNGAGGSGDADGTGDIVFLYQGSGSYGGGIPLEANQQLLGERHGLTVNGNLLVAAGATAPVITNGSGAGVGLANGVDVQGLNISGTSGDGINGSAVTTATVGTTTPVSISSALGDGVDLSGAASGNISIASPITGSTGHSVAVANRSGGTTTFSGSIADSGTGISLSSNTGATIDLTGGVTASTGASNAFSATGGGTVNVTGASNTLATTTGTALNVANSNIGASGLTFRSVSSNGGTNGIVLNNTGASGGLTVTGNGGSCTFALQTCTGGEIRNKTGDAVSLTNTASPSLALVNVHDNDGNGVLASGVSGLSLANSLFVANSDDLVTNNEANLRMQNMSGTSSITSSVFRDAAVNNVYWTPNSGAATLNASGSTFGPNNGLTGGSGLLLDATGTAAPTLSITGGSFTGNRGDSLRPAFSGSASGNVTVSGGTTFTDSNSGVNFSVDSNADLTYDVSGSTFLRHNSHALQMIVNDTATGSSSVHGTAASNAIGDTTADSGSRDANGISFDLEGGGAIVLSVTGNTIQHTDTQGIFIQTRRPISPASAGPATDLTLRDNSVTNIDDNSPFPFGFQHGTQIRSRNVSNLCLDIAGNSSTGIGGAQGFRVAQSDTSTFRLERLTGSGTDDTNVANFVAGQNDAGSTAIAAHATTFTSVADGTCQNP